LGRLLLLAAIVWCAAYSIWDAHDRSVWKERGVTATAVVTDVSCGGRGSYVHLDVAGTEQVILPCPFPEPRVGEHVQVVYDSADASDVRLSQEFERASGRSTLLVAVGTTALLGVLEWSWWRERRHTRLVD